MLYWISDTIMTILTWLLGDGKANSDSVGVVANNLEVAIKAIESIDIVGTRK